MQKAIWKKSIIVNDKPRSICVYNRDFSEIDEPVDVFICSAYKREYRAFPGTIFETLYQKMNISVEEEAEKSEFDYRATDDFWISRNMECSIKRIACIELLDISFRNNVDAANIKLLSEGFIKLYELLMKMNYLGLRIEKVVLPVLGSGNQGLEMCYIIPTLIEQSLRALKDISQIKEIIFCEKNEEKASELVKTLKNLDKKTDKYPDVFISYCSAQRERADALREMLHTQGIACWMAPYSIPAGSSYQEEIPAALSKSSLVLLVLSKEAELSRWVQKEVGCAIGMKHTLVPYQSEPYEHSLKFSFLLDGEQIFEADQTLSEKEKVAEVVEYLRQKLGLSERQTDEKNGEDTIKEEPVTKRKKPELKLLDISLIGIGLTLILELYLVIKQLKKITGQK